MQESTTSLEIIRNAYAAVGIVHVVRTTPEKWCYLFLTNPQDKQRFETEDLDTLLRDERFLEFNETGELVSY